MRFGDWSRRRFVGGFINDLSEVERQVRGLRRSGVLSFDASQVEGDLIGNRIIAPTDASNTEPTDPNFSGWFLSAALQALTDGNFGLANVLLGAVQYGIGESGEFIRGVSFLSNHLATVGAYDRRARRGFQELDSKPAYLIEYIDDAVGTNLVTVNPEFESGSLTGWTAADTEAGASWAASTDSPYSGSYCARYITGSTTGAGNCTLTSNKYAITGDTAYRCAIAARHARISVVLNIRWYDSGSSLLRTDVIYSCSASTAFTWELKQVALLSPSSATQVEVYVYGSWSSAMTPGVKLDVDSASIVALSEYAYSRWDDNGKYDGDEVAEVNTLGIPQSDLQFADQMITAVTVVDTVDSTYKW